MSDQTSAPENGFTYDVFISYSTRDKDWVRGELLRRLEDSGLKVCIDYRDFQRGAPTVQEIERAATTSRKTFLVLTPNYLESEWVKYERYLLQTLDPTNNQLRLIPLLKEQCDLPISISFLTYVDFVETDDIVFAWTQLLTALGKQSEAEALKKETPRQWLLAHPYGMPPNFTGRKAELQMLSDWLNGDTSQPLFVLRALGGFGKSALTWHWLTEEVDSRQWRQVVWWSFYEEAANFNNFLRLTLAYLTGRNPDMPPREQLESLLILLQQNRMLLVMDGFERQLRAYSGMGAAYQGDEIPPAVSSNGGMASSSSSIHGGPKGDQSGRDCINPFAEAFLRNIASLPHLKGKVLMSTRLRPGPVELHGGMLLQGCREEELTQMQPADAVAFFQRQGIRGSRVEIQQACETYGYHPLSLRLLAGYIVEDFQYPGDIKVAESLDLTGDLVQRRNHVLERSYENLSSQGRQMLGRIACFRSPVAYSTLEAIGQAEHSESDRDNGSVKILRVGLRNLLKRGLLHQDNRANRQGRPVAMFDLHPIVRRYTYDRIGDTDRIAVHAQLRDYFAAVPGPDKVTTLEDLATVIELYHHMVRAGQYDKAGELFQDRLSTVTYYQLGAYQLRIELLQALFPQGEDQPPNLKDESSQAWTLSALANSYSRSGQPAKAVPLYEQGVAIYERRDDKKELAIVLGNLANRHRDLGALQAAEANLRRRIALCRKLRTSSVRRSPIGNWGYCWPIGESGQRQTRSWQ